MGCSGPVPPNETQAHPSTADLGLSHSLGDIVQTGCGLAGSVANYVTCPAGWTADGEGITCHFCPSDDGSACLDCSGAIVGNTLQCKMTSYTGSQTLCATLGSDPSGICDPANLTVNLSSTNATLDSIMNQYCTVNSCQNWGTTTCQQWIDVRGSPSTLGQQAVASYCAINDNMPSSYCTNYASANPGILDTVSIAYCHGLQSNGDTSLDDTFCACLNLSSVITSNPLLTEIALNPACYYNLCSSGSYGAYQTLAQQNSAKTCESITICAQSISVNSITDSSAITLSNECAISNTTTTTTKSSGTSSTNGTYSLFILIIVSLIAFFVLIFPFLKKIIMPKSHVTHVVQKSITKSHK